MRLTDHPPNDPVRPKRSKLASDLRSCDVTEMRRGIERERSLRIGPWPIKAYLVDSVELKARFGVLRSGVRGILAQLRWRASHEEHMIAMRTRISFVDLYSVGLRKPLREVHVL